MLDRGFLFVAMLMPLAVAGQTHESPLGPYFRPWSQCLAGQILAPEAGESTNYDEVMDEAFEACENEESKFMADVPAEERQGFKEQIRSMLRLVWDAHHHGPQGANQ